MNIEDLRHYCLSKPAVTEGFPFDEDTLVFKVKGKMFLLVSLEKHPLSFNVKAAPDDVIQYQEQYDEITPGYHMSKKHWVTVMCDGGLSSKFLFTLIDDSYRLVVDSLPKKDRMDLLP